MIRELVRIVSHKLEIPASECWLMSVADLLLTAIPPAANNKKTFTNNAELRAWAREHDERIAMRRRLTVEQRIELERFINQVT
ncbi:hypothetical protein [Fimbriiglobus ruber]|uniref:hypothetical protein n=1 Tax=Fimbriiglobus ruber TaxID=1908690 RepID=UPI00117A69EF|nr:hypothetical protein [Fimbriiglobus ruber]